MNCVNIRMHGATIKKKYTVTLRQELQTNTTNRISNNALFIYLIASGIDTCHGLDIKKLCISKHCMLLFFVVLSK